MMVQQFTKQYKGTRGLWRRVPLVVIDGIHTIAEATDKVFPSWLQLWRLLNDDFFWYKNARKLGLTATLDSDEREAVNAFVPGAEQWVIRVITFITLF